jgi:hypothetical protein
MAAGSEKGRGALSRGSRSGEASGYNEVDLSPEWAAAGLLCPLGYDLDPVSKPQSVYRRLEESSPPN